MSQSKSVTKRIVKTAIEDYQRRKRQRRKRRIRRSAEKFKKSQQQAIDSASLMGTDER